MRYEAYLFFACYYSLKNGGYPYSRCQQTTDNDQLAYNGHQCHLAFDSYSNEVELPTAAKTSMVAACEVAKSVLYAAEDTTSTCLREVELSGIH